MPGIILGLLLALAVTPSAAPAQDVDMMRRVCARVAVLDPARVYEVPWSEAQNYSQLERAAARLCARRYGIRYVIRYDR